MTFGLARKIIYMFRPLRMLDERRLQDNPKMSALRVIKTLEDKKKQVLKPVSHTDFF